MIYLLWSSLKGLVQRKVQARLSKPRWVSYDISDESRNEYGAAVYLEDSIRYRYN